MGNSSTFLNLKPNAPVLAICGYCAKLFPQVDAAIRAAMDEGNVQFNHGSCINHILEQYKAAGFTEPQLRAIAQKYALSKKPAPPDLRKRPDLIQAYSQGNFFPEQGQSQQSLKERLQKLANITKDIKHGTPDS